LDPPSLALRRGKLGWTEKSGRRESGNEAVSRKDAKTPRREGAGVGRQGKLPFCKFLVMRGLFSSALTGLDPPSLALRRGKPASLALRRGKRGGLVCAG
jgi:hypothetical protein